MTMSEDDTEVTPPAPAPRDGDNGQPPGEEELLLKIAEQKDLICEFPGDTYAAIRNRVLHQRKLGRLEFTYAMVGERKRLSAVLAEYQERHCAIYSEPCLICLDDVFVNASDSRKKVFSCCGGFICMACAKPGLGFDKCPLCRKPMPTGTVAEVATRMVALAERGVGWAQADVGKGMIMGRAGFKKQEKAGLEWLNKAAAQNHPPALYSLSAFHRDGRAALLVKSEEKANELLLKAANLGHISANSELAIGCFAGINGFGEDRDEACFRASVAFALDNTDGRAAWVLGAFHHYEEVVPDPSRYLACYYLNIAANGEADSMACYLYSQELYKLGDCLHDMAEIPGSNALPAMFFWLRKSRDLGYSDAIDRLKEWEARGQRKCVECLKDAVVGVNFKHCSKCRAQWYCSKECQVEAWKTGHRNDCKRARMLKFEDYLNAD